MLASTRPNQGKRERRGVVLVLILGVLALMAVIGVAFATFSGQSRISARNFAQSVNQPQRDELMDYALSQLICDTPDIRSSIRGHSLARDMYGNDANFNGYLAYRPDGAFMAPNNDPYFYITYVTAAGGTLYTLQTNIPAGDSAFYGYSFTRWTLRVTYNGTLANGGTYVVAQTLEVLVDTSANGFRAFTVNIAPTDAATTLVSSEVSSTNVTTRYNTQLPGTYLVQAATNNTYLGATCPFILDGRWLHAFNGPGMTINAVHGNFRYNGQQPNAVGMDEDYDAVDLENWFLAMQSADGSVIIPSFHRPAAIRYDPNGVAGTVVNDWQSSTPDSMARILRPRQFDGNDPNTFPDLVPNATGGITYDVDNDGDGFTDSVWVDLGYPARRNAQGQLYKPLFAFMVIGLNGRIPLNTAGNLAGGRGTNPSTHAAHLGNSVSEVDPTYGLQNAFQPLTTDPGFAYTTPVYATPPNTSYYPAQDSQVDSGGIDVRLTQLRNLLAGTRPQTNPGVPGLTPGQPDPTGQTNGDNNLVVMNGYPYFMPNGIADTGDVDGYGNSRPTAVFRLTPAVAGRWGEAQSVPGYPKITNPNPPPPLANLVVPTYSNPIRAGYSEDIGDLLAGTARDAADDNLNSFDPYPPVSATDNRLGEVGDLDFLDPAGAFLLPVERMRRFVTPADINGTGRIVQHDGVDQRPGPDLGPDQWGRVEYSSYFRPPGLPGQVPPTPAGGPLTTGVTFPWTSGENYPTTTVSNITPPAPVTSSVYNNNNPLHGFEAQRFPNLNYGDSLSNPQRAGGVPFDLGALAGNTLLPGTLPTYDAQANGKVQSDGLNEADEMNLYQPNAQLDSPFGYGDLEWLYRQQDVDGASLTSRLAQLAPISFTNSVDGQRRRRLYALDSWEMNNFAWTNDNPLALWPLGPYPPATAPPVPLQSTLPGFYHPYALNSRFSFNDTPPPSPQNASFYQLGLNQVPSNSVFPAPTVVHRDKKINLNYPLPVSNDPNEAVRVKWITDTYNTLKAILPPLSVDSAEELAQLSQYVINIIDFRDPDATMTHWLNPDVFLRPGTAGTSPFLVLAKNKATGDIPLDQYGMEYNPIAINEVLAYSFQSTSRANRFFIELVNTLTSPELGPGTNGGGPGPGLGTPTNNASVLDLAGFQSNPTPPLPSPPLTTPWDGGCWDLVFTNDDPMSRPDPVEGQLQPGGTFWSLIPLVSGTGTTAPIATPYVNPATPAGDPVIFALPQAPPQTPGATGAVNFFIGDNTLTPVAPYYFTTIGSPLSVAGSENAPIVPTYTLSPNWDPVNTGVPTSAVPQGVLAGATYGTWLTGYPQKIPFGVAPTTGSAQFYWVCLRRPANPFAGVSAQNPMIVVDAMRFPFIESGGTTSNVGKNYIYSYQRLQPFRGGQAVPMPGVTGGALDPRYGYSDQVAVPTSTTTNTFGQSGSTQITGPATGSFFYHTLGTYNDAVPGTPGGVNPGSAGPPVIPPSLYESWDFFPFNDRDFTSVAELLMVPGCPPGLFTKQFAEFSASQTNLTGVFSKVTPLSTPQVASQLAAPATASQPFNAGVTLPSPFNPHAFPYLVDKFFYTAASPTPPLPTSPVFGDPTGDGWFKMFEFFEVPSQMIGAVGPVAQGANFDWLRQDTKPGLINLNLIIDEEVFFSVFGQQDQNFNQQLMNFYQLPLLGPLAFQGASMALSPPATFNATTATAATLPMTAGSPPVPIVVTATTAYGSPAAAYPMHNVGVLAVDPVAGIGNRMKAAFAQFLSLRQGGSGYVFGYGSGLPGQNATVLTGNPNAPTTPALAMVSPIPADRPFHSLSYPDIDYTIMRPAALPPSAYSDPLATVNPTIAWPPSYNSTANNYTADPGVRNPSVYQGFTTSLFATTYPLPGSLAPGTTPQSTPAGTGTVPLLMPPAVPPRRLFQPPDAFWSSTTNPTPPPANIITGSNASDTGDEYLNNLVPVTATAATGALPLFFTGYTPNAYMVNLVWPAGSTLPSTTPTMANPYLGSNSVAASNGPPVVQQQTDMKQHPYFRTELLQKAMNLTTVRTHQYAVWITIGFFEVTRQGDLLMIQQGNPVLAYDQLGPEIGASTGQTTRFRGFFLIDRLQLTGYDPNVIGSFRPAVVYRQTIE